MAIRKEKTTKKGCLSEDILHGEAPRIGNSDGNKINEWG